MLVMEDQLPLIELIDDLNILKYDAKHPNVITTAKYLEITMLLIDEFRGCIARGCDFL